MLKFQAHALIEAINNLATAESIIRHWNRPLDGGAKQLVQTHVDKLIEQTKQLDLPVSLKKAKALSFALTQDLEDKATHGDILKKFMGELRERLQHELESKTIYVIPKHQAYLESTVPPFGEDVHANFPSARYDIEEAGKCLALSRYTACVTHLMRALEVGLGAISSELHVTFSQPNWANLIDQIEKAVRGISKASHGDDWKEHRQFFSEAAAHFRVPKDAWRNHAMHAHECYNEENAEIIFMSVRAFMRQLAKRLSE